jgi:hypothetical protein
MIYPPLDEIGPTRVMEVVDDQPAGAQLRIVVEGPTIEGNVVGKTVLLPLGPPGDSAQRLAFAGLDLAERDGRVLVDNIVFGSPAEREGIDFDWEIRTIELPAQRPPKEWMFVPALILLTAVVGLQRRRRNADAVAPAAG